MKGLPLPGPGEGTPARNAAARRLAAGLYPRPLDAGGSGVEAGEVDALAIYLFGDGPRTRAIREIDQTSRAFRPQRMTRQDYLDAAPAPGGRAAGQRSPPHR
jgi:hypothetical protein